MACSSSSADFIGTPLVIAPANTLLSPNGNARFFGLFPRFLPGGGRRPGRRAPFAGDVSAAKAQGRVGALRSSLRVRRRGVCRGV
jgi:hypothetical protein